MVGLKSVISRALQFQTLLPHAIKPLPTGYSLNRFWSTYSPAMTNQQQQIQLQQQDLDPEINRTLSFWFSQKPMSWFQQSDELDEEIKSQFSDLVVQARTASGISSPSVKNDTQTTSKSKIDDEQNSLDIESWKSTPLGSLALIILLDQFPRNLYRGTGASFSSDRVAFEIATRAVAKTWDQQLADQKQRMFLYMPLMHDESLISQIACLELLKVVAETFDPETQKEEKEFFTQGGVDAAIRHRDVILRFGRYPARNKALGRESTKEELEFLAENPHGL